MKMIKLHTDTCVEIADLINTIDVAIICAKSNDSKKDDPDCSLHFTEIHGNWSFWWHERAKAVVLLYDNYGSKLPAYNRACEIVKDPMYSNAVLTLEQDKKREVA